MTARITTRFATFALVSLAGIPYASADLPPPEPCGTKAGAPCAPGGLMEGGFCVEESGVLTCAVPCGNGAAPGEPCCDSQNADPCCNSSANNGVCKAVPGNVNGTTVCDTSDSRACINQNKGASCKTEAGEAGTCETVGDSSCSFLMCTPTATSGSSTSATTGGTSSSGGKTSSVGGGTSGGPNSSGGCSIEGRPAGASLGMGLLAAALGATALGRRRGARRRHPSR